MATLGKNQVFEIKNGDGTSFHNLVLRKSAVESIVMSLGDKISGDVYYKDNSLSVTMHEYITYNGVNYMLVNPPTIVREGIVSDNSELKGMTKYSFVFYHPMCQLANFPFSDVAVTSDETRYLGEGKTFSWIGKPADFVAKLNKNLTGTEWIVELSSRFPQDKLDELSNVIPFDNATIADACKTFYDTWGVPYVVDKVASTEASYAAGKRFKIVMGLPSNEIYSSAQAEQQGTPFVFQMGHGVGLKNNSRTPRNNKIITRISGYGSENNIPYGYPQVRWYGTAGQAFTYGDHAGVYTDVTIDGVHLDKVISYPIYKGVLDGEYVELIKHPFTRAHLMPSVYRTCLFNKISFLDDNGEFNTDYNPDITLIDYYDAIYSSQYPYPNTINLQAPSYESHEFEDEKPELGEAHIISATPLNNDLTPASSWDDSLDDEGNYKQSYFQMVLPQLSFDLYACASITEEMQINMRSGTCLGCTFTVQVDWDDYKRNFYDEEGNFAPNGSQRDLTKYPKSNQGSISLVLQKDNSTFGTLMPNMYQYPKGETSSGAGDGDTFVILGISLPESYIFAAEWRLDADMKSYMLENNVHYFDYPLKFDEDFLFHNENILSQIRPNTVVRFNYAGQTQALFVKQITVKYGDQPLPQYDITLTDNVEVVLNKIGQVAEDVEKLSTLIAILRQSYGKNVWSELAKKLSKTQDDTAAGYITMLKGLQIGANFVPDILGEGGVLRMRDDGKVELVTDILYARVKAYFDSVEIREYQHTGGNRIASVAGNKICRVAWYNSSNVELEQTQANLASVAYFRCYFRASDGEDTVRNNWVIGDQAYCHITSVTTSSDNPEQKGLNQKHLWRLVIGRNTEGTLTEDGEAYIDLSNRATETISGNSYTGYQSGSDIPEAQDDIIQLGNVNDTTRQGAIVEFVTGTDAPSYQIYQGINSFSLNGKNQIGFGYNTATGKADMKVYGDAYIGARDRSTFIEYKQDDGTEAHAPKLKIKAEIEATSTIGSQSLPNYIKANQTTYDQAIADLQNQIDGAIDTWFYNGAPSDSVLPESEWKAIDIAAGNNNERLKHLGDIYYDNKTGYAYRYTNTGTEQSPTFAWSQISDSAVIEALQKAAKAQATADGKMTIYSVWGAWMKNNVNTLKVGDLFIPNADTEQGTKTYKAKKVYKCTTDGVADFEEIAYTDDTTVERYMDILANGMNNPQTTKEVALATEQAIRNALGGATVLAGGLMLTSLIGLRQFDGGDASDYRNYTTWAGISGQYNANALGKGIAAWYGGDMVDKEALSAETIDLGWGTGTGQYRWAKSLDRFDGSGYRANGNISWTEDGALTIKNITTLSDSNNKNILNELATFNSAFTFSTTGEGSTTVLSITPQQPFTELYIGTAKNDSTKAATQGWVNQNFVTTTFFDNLFRLYNGYGNSATQINVNGTLPTDKTNLNIEAMFGFWTKKYISALGQGDDGSTSYTTLAQLNDVTLTNPTANQILVYDGTHWRNQNQQSVYELPTASADTLGGVKVGTTLAISSGVLNLPTTGVTAGTYKRVTVDAYGRVTSGDNTDTDTNTWRNIYVGGTSKVGTGIDTKAINFKAGSNVSLSFAAAGTGSGQSGSANYFDVVISATDTTYSAATQSAAGLMSAADKKKLDGIAEGANKYSLPLAANGTRGGVQIGFTTDAANRNYAVQLSSEKMYVNVPWENTWRGIQNNLTSQSTTDSLSAYQGYLLANGSARDNSKLPLTGGTLTGTLTARDVVVQSAYTLKIGDAILKWDNENNALKLYKLSGSSEVAVNLYATGGISALGQNIDGSSGAGDVTWALLANNSDSRQIASSHLTSVLSGYLPLTGGVLSGGLTINNSADLCLKAASGSAYAGDLVFLNDSNVEKGRLWKPYESNEFRVRFSESDSAKVLIHSGNLGDYLGNSVQHLSCLLGGGNVGWVNIARLPLNTYGAQDAQSFDLYVGRYYNSPNSEAFTCNISTGWGVGSIKVTNRIAPYPIVEYVRIAQDNNYRYVQLYVNTSYTTYPNLTLARIIGCTLRWEGMNEVASGSYTEICSASLTSTTGYAYQGADNNFINHTNEFNFVPSSFSDYIYINYRTASGSNGNIGKYLFCNGAGSVLAVLDNCNGGTILTNNNVKTINGQSIYGSGDITVSGGGGGGGNYLPIAGGTMTGLLNINTYGNTVTIGSQNNDWCHIYNSSSIPFIFNRSVWSMGGLYPYNTNSNSIGDSGHTWGSLYVRTINCYSVYATNDVTALSDARHKTIIRATNLSVEQIASMPSVVYKWNDGREDNSLHVGSIAQNWQSVLPEVVLTTNNEEHTLSMQYGVAALISAITVARKVMTHEEKIALLETRVSALEKENGELIKKIEQLKIA